MQKWQCPIYSGTHLYLIFNLEEPVIFLTRKVFISVSFSIASYNKEFASHFRSETVFENKQFKETKTLE